MNLIMSEQEGEIPSYATSLVVPNVQEMVVKDPLEVPERYIRNEMEMEKEADMSHLSSQVPVIDLSLLSNGDKDELVKLDMACTEWGFFQVTNHGMEGKVMQGMKDASAEFFALPLEEKNKISMPPDDIQGYGHAYVVSEDQTLDWSDALIMVVHPSKFRKLSIWPTEPKQVKQSIESYSSELKRVAEELLGSLSLVMGIEKGSLLELHKELVQALRLNYYPPCRMADKVLGISPHSDTSTISILMEHDNVAGLQIRHRGGWVPVKPVPNALVVNVGDVIEILTNGKYKSVEHRAVTNESKTRLSYATFFFPRDDVEFEPLGVILDSDGSTPIYKKVKYGEFLRQSLKMKHDGKSHTQIAKI